MTKYVLSISYGKDSLACIGAIEKLGLPLDRIIHAEIWFNDEIQADLPPMVEFKSKADKIIKERYGIDVEHFKADVTYVQQFYKRFESGKNKGRIYGFPIQRGQWCNSMLKMDAIKKAERSCGNDCVSYVGIALDEPKRLARLDGVKKISPLALIGWTEADCMKWCIENDLRSPQYDVSSRGGCWFCHNKGVDELRHLRTNYPMLWEKLMKLDDDSPITFRADGRTLHDFERRFQAEDDGIIRADERFYWKLLENQQYRLF